MRTILISAFFATVSVLAGAQGHTMLIGGESYDVDTVFHAKVGPGTTQTSLRLTGPSSLNVFYLTIDQTTPGVSIRTLSGGDKVAGNGRTSEMAQKHSHEGLHYFAGSNGDFYTTSGTATNGSSKVGTATYAFTSDREVFKTASSGYQFSVDLEGVARICRLNYQTGTISCGENSALFKAVNTGAPNNGVSLYTSKYWGSPNQTDYADNCSEVSLRLVDGENFYAGCKYKMEVTSEPTRTGDLTIPDGGFVIVGRGTGDTFVAGLHIGDIVEFDNITLTPEGEQIYPTCVVSGNPKNIGGGVNLNSEAERGDASDRHPRTGIGVSADGTKIVMMVVDGRTVASVGCTTGALGDILLYAGCAEGVNLDGGGSSTLYTEALGVRNHCSDGQERSVGNAVYAVLEAPESDVVAELGFLDYAPRVPYLGMYTPQIFAFNEHGLCISTDFQDYTLSCEPELGEVTADGKTLYVTGTGLHALTAHYGDISVSVPVYIEDATEAVLTYENVIIDASHPYSIGLHSMVSDRQVPLNPAALSWVTNDASVATVDEAGIVTAVSNGTTSVVGTLGDLSVEQFITVENTDKASLPMFAATDVANWSYTGSTLKDVTVSAMDSDGSFAVDYTIKTARGTKLTVTTNAKTYGIPKAFTLAFVPGEAKVSKVVVNLRAANNNSLTPVEFAEINAEGTTDMIIPIEQWFDATDAGIYPIELVSIAISMTDATNTVCHIEFPSVVANYRDEDGVESAVIDNDGNITIADGCAILPTDAQVITITDLAGRVITRTQGRSVALPEAHGVYILSADGAAVKIAR